MHVRDLKSVSWVLTLALVALIPVVLSAQVTGTTSGKATASDSPSKWDIFAGYSYLAPKGTVNNLTFNAVDLGSIFSVSRYFNKNLGFTLEGDDHILFPEDGKVSTLKPQNDFSGGSGGVIYRFPTGNMTPFIHGLVGGERVGRYGLGYKDVWGVVVTAGGGLDYETPFLHHHLAIRLFQADYQYTHEDFYPLGRGNFNMARLSAGVVFHKGGFAPPAAVTLACSASPASIIPGS